MSGVVDLHQGEGLWVALKMMRISMRNDDGYEG